jgi:hypothetical protein
MARQLARFAVLLILCCSAFLARSQQEPSGGITVVVIEQGHAGPSHPEDLPDYYRDPLVVRRASDAQIVARGTGNSKGVYTFAVPPGKYFITDAGQLRYPRNIRSGEVIVVKNKFGETLSR